MKILFIAKSFPGYSAYFIAQTIQEMGHSVVWFELPKSGGQTPSSTDRFKSFIKQNLPFSLKWYVHFKNKQIIETALKEKPDLVLVYRGYYILPETIQKLRRELNLTCFLWFHDPFYTLTETDVGTFRDYSRVFLKDHYLLHELQKTGMSNLRYLPQACYPELHKPPEKAPTFDYEISFIGRHYAQREHLFAGLENYRFMIYGLHWQNLQNKSGLSACWQGKAIVGEEAVSVYQRSMINLNTFHYSEIDSLNLRTFEITGSGGFMITEEKTILSEIFEPNHDIATFKDKQDMFEKIRYFLRHENERVEMAAAACKKVHQSHTFKHRLVKIFEAMETC